MSDFLINRVCAKAFENLNKTLGNLVQGGLNNPEKSLDDIYQTARNFLNYFLTVAAVAGVAMFLFAAFTYLTSYGEESKIETAKKTMIIASIGIVLVGLCKVILIMIAKTFNIT